MEPAKEASLEPSGDSVKEPKVLGVLERTRPRFARLFEGWELGAMTVGLVLATALLTVPRAARPGLVPVPLLDPSDARSARERSAALADRAEREGLPFQTRAVGDTVRRLGVALSLVPDAADRGGRDAVFGGRGDPEHLQRLLAERVQLAMAAGQADALQRLRAVQQRMFVRAVREQIQIRPVTPELAALGGDFVVRAARNGWIEDGRCVASDDELSTLFGLRWLTLTRLHEHPSFRPTLGELRRYYRFLLLYPEVGTHSEPSPEVERAAVRLRYVEALAKRDTEYPVALARGSLLGQLGQLPQSAQSLSQHLARPAGARFNLRARNYLIHAATRGPSELVGDEP